MSLPAAAEPRLRSLNLPYEQMFVVISRLVALVILIVVLSILSPYFLTWSNLVNVLRQASLQFMMSAGLTIVILTAGIDLSIGAVLGLAACVSASLISGGFVILGIASALLAGLACGTINGLLVTIGRIPPFIATYGMLWIAFGLGYVFMKGEVIYGLPEQFRFIGAGFLWGIPFPVIVAAALLIVLHFLLHRTVLGRSIYAIGGNPDAARLSGMPVTRRLVTVYALSGLLSGFAALVVIARINAADSGLGEDLLLPAIAAVCLGGTSLFGGIGGIMGTAVGSIILAMIVNGMNLLGVQTFWQNAVMGTIILISVLADQLGGTRLAREQ
jgi:ribose transport system permease protein